MKEPKNQLSNEVIKNRLEDDLSKVSSRVDELFLISNPTELERHEASNLMGQQAAYSHALRLLGWIPPYMRDKGKVP